MKKFIRTLIVAAALLLGALGSQALPTQTAAPVADSHAAPNSIIINF